ncbi:MAG: hypothetical protein WBC73_08635, partial [Phormidesmis sp.]
MSSRGRVQWDASRFFTTLTYFGEIPFLGSFRWLQELLGQRPTYPGIVLSAMKKKTVVVGDRASNLFDSLQKQCPPSIELIRYWRDRPSDER